MLLLPILLAACKIAGPDEEDFGLADAEKPAGLQGTWLLEHVTQAGETASTRGIQQPVLTFQEAPDDSTLVGFTGCNLFAATYRVLPENQLHIKPRSASKRTCSWWGTELFERRLLNGLYASPSFTLESETRLRIHYGEGTLVFTRAPDPNLENVPL